MKVNILMQINAPIDLVWELLAEGTTAEHCPVTGIRSHEIIEEHEDGITQKVSFNGRPMIKRVYVDDESHKLLVIYRSLENDQQEGVIENKLAEQESVETIMNFTIDWFSDDVTEQHINEVSSNYQSKLTEFKTHAENIWGSEQNEYIAYQHSTH